MKSISLKRNKSLGRRLGLRTLCFRLFLIVTCWLAIPVQAQVTTYPDYFTVSNVASSSVTLNWLPSATYTVSSFKIYRDGVNVGSTTNLTYTDQGLTAATIYKYQVSAVVSGSEMKKSFELSIRTRGTAQGTAAPQIFFTDLVSGPKSGWSASQPTRGCAVSVWGVNLGELRNNSTLEVCGATLSQDSDFAEWGLFNAPSPFLQRITFWLNDTCVDGAGKISVTVNGVQSNQLDFTVRAGRIKFVDNTKSLTGTGSLTDPWKSGTSFAQNKLAGDICYFRAGVHNTSYNGGQDVFWFRALESATQAAPITLAAYPGEQVIFDALNNHNVNFQRGIQVDGAYYTFSKITIHAWGAAASIGKGGRLVGCDCSGTAGLPAQQTGIINTIGESSWILGNRVRGGRSGDRFDHAIYAGGNASVGPTEFGWNYIHDNSHERGPMISLNHQDNRCPWPQTVKAHYTHSNIVDCTNYPSRAIASYDMSWDPQDGENVEPEPSYIFNNFLINCGMTKIQSADGYSQSAIELNNGRHYVFNNTLYNSSGQGIISGNGNGQIESKLFNNIIHMDPAELRSSDSSIEYILKTFDYANTPITVLSNLYFGIGNYNSRHVNFNDAQAVTGDPLWTNVSLTDFTLKTGSLALSSSYPDIETLLNDDALIGSPKPTSVALVINRLSGRAGIDANLVGAFSYSILSIEKLSAGFLSPGNYGLLIKTIPGQSYTIETSSDLINWQPQQTLVATGTTLQFTIPTNSVTTFFTRVKMN